MIIYIDINSRQLRKIQSPTVSITSLVMFLRDKLSIGVVFVDGDTPVTATVLANGAVLRLGIKTSALTNTLLASSTTYSLVGSQAMVTLNLNTNELIAYFTDMVGSGVRGAPFIFEVQVEAGDASTVQTMHQSEITIQKDVNTPTDIDPTPGAASLYVLKGALFDGNGNPITGAFPNVRLDIATTQGGGATAINGLMTATLPHNSLWFFKVGGQVALWLFEACTTADGALIQGGADYNVGTNPYKFVAQI